MVRSLKRGIVGHLNSPEGAIKYRNYAEAINTGFAVFYATSANIIRESRRAIYGVSIFLFNILEPGMELTIMTCLPFTAAQTSSPVDEDRRDQTNEVVWKEVITGFRDRVFMELDTALWSWTVQQGRRLLGMRQIQVYLTANKTADTRYEGK